VIFILLASGNEQDAGIMASASMTQYWRLLRQDYFSSYCDMSGTLLCFFFNFVIDMCIQGLGHFSPLPPPPRLPPTPPSPSPPHPLNTQQKLFCPYF
jgi:hypothetical protein